MAVQRTLGYIHSADAGLLFELLKRKHELMHADARKRRSIFRQQLVQQIVRIEHRSTRRLGYALASQRHYVRQRTHYHQVVAIEAAHFTHALVAVHELQLIANARIGQIRLQQPLATHWTAARTAAAMRS